MNTVLPTFIILALASSLSLAADEPAFTPPGPNLALNKPYTLDPAPNYGDCSLDPKLNLLTDGEYTQGYFWVQKTSVGWVHKQPVVVTIDLGKVEPIAGLSFNTAAGIAGVNWPSSLSIMISDDRKQWTMVGDLATLSNKRWAPSPTIYRIHRFATDELQAHGRYVALIVDQTPYTVMDEIEIFRGPEALLTKLLTGKQVAQAPLDYWKETRVANLIRLRLQADLDEICKVSATAKLSPADKAQLQARVDKLRAEIEAFETVPADFTTVLPLNDLHTRVYALNAPVLRARGYKGLTPWAAYRYDPLQPLQAPERGLAKVTPVSDRMMRNEHRAEVYNLTNATDAPLAAFVQATSGLRPGCLNLRQIIFTDTRDRIPVAAALSNAEPAERGLRVTVPAGTTAQLWLDFDTKDVPAGDYKSNLSLACPGQSKVTVPLTLHVTPQIMPDEFSVAIGGWDETNGRGSYDINPDNMDAVIKSLREHGVNMPWNNPRAVPFGGEYGAEGDLTAPLDFSTWDEWVNKWQGAQHWGVFANVKDNFHGEPMGTPRFNKMVGAWTKSWVDHAAAQGIKPAQIKVLLVDEPTRAEQDKIIIAWAKAMHAVEPLICIWNDPLHTEPEKVDADFYTHCDVLSPNMGRFFNLGKPYQDFMVAQRDAGRELWFYSCTGPAKLLDPATYWRGQFWLNLKYGGKGSCYWAFGDEAGNSWNAYVQPRASYSPLFLSKTSVTDAKQMESIREGAQDYEYFQMLRACVAQAEKRGLTSKSLADAKAFLIAGPDRAVATMGAEAQKWSFPKDRTVMDTVRLQALDLLEKLSKL